VLTVGLKSTRIVHAGGPAGDAPQDGRVIARVDDVLPEGSTEIVDFFSHVCEFQCRQALTVDRNAA
jgi:hypothetical protein